MLMRCRVEIFTSKPVATPRGILKLRDSRTPRRKNYPLI